MKSTDSLFLPDGYTENSPEVVATDGAGFWAGAAETRIRNARRYQDAVYRFAARLGRDGGTVLDIGCGTGQSLVRHLGARRDRTVGVDQPTAIAHARTEFPDHEWIAGDLRSDELWDELGSVQPSLAICADVIEHVGDPRQLLARLHRLVGPNGRLVLSTPDRDRLEDRPPLGPPRNPHHVREWSFDEMTRLVTSAGFVIRGSRHVLPRRFSWSRSDAKIVAWRALHGRAVPARRSCMVFELAQV